MRATPTSVAVLGFGTMGQGIARLLVEHGLHASVVDVDAAKAREVAVRLTGAAQAARSTPVGSISVCASVPEAVEAAEVVFEALPEVMELKVRVLREVADVRPSALLFTNTSSLPVDDIADAMGNPRTLIGVHFFNPAEVMPGVEVIPARSTDPSVTERALSMLSTLGKTPTVVQSSPGFIANRLQLALFAEAARCVEEGLGSPADIDQVVRTTFGLRLAAYGPFAIADMAGLDIFAAILHSLQTAFGERFEAPPGLTEKVAAQQLGTKTQGGYFSYDEASVAGLEAERNQRYLRIAQAAGPVETVEPVAPEPPS